MVRSTGETDPRERRVKLKLMVAVLAMMVTGAAGAQNLTAAGATFPYPIYNRWFSEYAQLHPNVHINYQSIGSGGGKKQAGDGTVDFGASDGPMTDEELGAAKIKLEHIPTVLGAVVPIYNVPGVTRDMNFSGDVIADIYLGKITKWNDSRIAKDNPGVNLPDKPILPVYRSDSSGTTYIFTDYLSKVNPDWLAKVGRNTAVKWPAGIGAKGSEGVSGMVRQAPYSFGYVELIFAIQNKMAYGSVKNAAGKFLQGSADGATAAAAAAAKNMPADYRVSITNAPGPTSYPISSFTWLLVPKQFADPAKGTVVKGFLDWMLEHGESEASGMGYAPLPAQVQAMVKKTITTIK
jgi:phosphate transport system substrate-binding protein